MFSEGRNSFMRGWRKKILFALIMYFAGFATAIYALAPAGDRIERTGSDSYQNRDIYQGDDSAESKSEAFAKATSVRLRKFVGFAGEKAVEAGELIKAKLAERQQQSEK